MSEKLRALCHELLTYLPDSDRYKYLWDEYTEEEQEAIKAMRQRAKEILKPEIIHGGSHREGYQPYYGSSDPNPPKGGTGQSDK